MESRVDAVMQQLARELSDAIAAAVAAVSVTAAAVMIAAMAVVGGGVFRRRQRRRERERSERSCNRTFHGEVSFLRLKR